MTLEKRKPIEVVDWGRLGYGPAYGRQKQLVQDRLTAHTPDRLILVEHPPVVTIGRSGGAGDLLVSEALLRKQGIELFEIDRGGRATFHGPGQMVAYPIIKLDPQDIRLYVQKLLEAVADVLRAHGLHPEYKLDQPGIWVSGKKIASIGVSVKKWITSHGVALNVNTDLTTFQWIVPCGHTDEVVTSMAQEIGKPVDFKTIQAQFAAAFKKRFGYGESSVPRHPKWLQLPLGTCREGKKTESMIRDLNLITVCESARCPNLAECFNRGTATFMILGSHCTRNCRFCAVEHGRPQPVDLGEPERLALAVQRLKLHYAVVTSVTRDDLSDGGASQFVRTIGAIRRYTPGVDVEVLIPDFKGSRASVASVCKAGPDMFNHNIETVPRLYPQARPQASFQGSLDVLAMAVGHGLRVKSGMMLGLGETAEEIRATLAELRSVGCEYLTLGQYLAPSKAHIAVDRYVSPDEFNEWARMARQMGFRNVAAGALVRSSYRAERMASCKEGQKKYA